MGLYGKLPEDPTLVRQIFDHFRNVGIAGVVIGASRWTWSGIESKSGFIFYMQLAQTMVFVAVGLWLFGLNLRTGLNLLHSRYPPLSWQASTVEFIYTFFIFALLAALAGVDPNVRP